VERGKEVGGKDFCVDIRLINKGKDVWKRWRKRLRMYGRVKED